MDTPQIYVACLASYNNGFLHGKWIDATQNENEIYNEIHEMLAASSIENAAEWAIHDYSGFGTITLDEYESIEHIVNLVEIITEYGELGCVLLENYSIEDVHSLLADSYHGSYDCEVDFARTMFEECYSYAIPDNLICYFDYGAFANDLFINDYFSVEAEGHTHVFSYH